MKVVFGTVVRIGEVKEKIMDLSKFNNSTFCRGAPRWKETLWWIVRSLFFASWFPLPSGLKVFWLRIFGAQVGANVVIRSRVNITFPWKLEIGEHVWIGDEVTILSLDRVSIGDHVCISQQAFLCTGSHDFSRHTFDLVTGSIHIGSQSWIGAKAFVGPSVAIGEGSRCLAGAVVVKSIEAGITVGGVPAVSI